MVQGGKLGVLVNSGDGDAVFEGRFHLGVGVGTVQYQVGGRVHAPTAQMARRHQAVGAIVSRSHQHQHPLACRAAQFVSNGFGHRQSRVFHQSVQTDSVAYRGLFQTHHLVHGDNFHPGLSLRITTKATA